MQEYALCLGGGGAKGFAHVGVLRFIQEKKICISEVSGTSMGALVGACYAIGMSYDDMIDFAHSISYIRLVDLHIGQGFIQGNKIYSLLQKIFGERNIEDLDIPLSIVATDLSTGTPYTFTRGKIVDAVRASISVPVIMKPCFYENSLLIDGGLSENLPLSSIKSSSIIAVSVIQRDLDIELKDTHSLLGINIKKGTLSSSIDMTKKVVTISIANNEKNILSLYKNKNIFLVTPDTRDYDYTDFYKYKDIISQGYNAGIQDLPNIT